MDGLASGIQTALYLFLDIRYINVTVGYEKRIRGVKV